MIKATLLRAEQDTQQNLKIIMKFENDGGVIVPEWVLWAKMENFLGYTPTQIRDWIKINCEYQIGNLIKAIARNTINDDILGKINAFQGYTIQLDKTQVVMSSNLVNATEFTVEMQENGTVTKV